MNNEDTPKDTLRSEYPPDLIRSGQRGKYTTNYRTGTNLVPIDPDLYKLFPTATDVNYALRKYAEEHQIR
ncbi:hypothetical protein TI04_04645 [Achromatium sp. WMS2]|nr:hypothetical protein TI04_04645 [Achromatium sp. WMS2]